MLGHVAVFGLIALATLAPTEELFGNYNFLLEIADVGETSVAQLPAGRIGVETVGQTGTITVVCGDSQRCHEAGLDGQSLEASQDIQIVIDVIGAGVKGQGIVIVGDILSPVKGRMQGTFQPLGLAAEFGYDATVNGAATCVGDEPNVCSVMDVDLWMKANLSNTGLAWRIGSLTLAHAGTLRQGDTTTSPTWENVVSSGEVLFKAK